MKDFLESILIVILGVLAALLFIVGTIILYAIAIILWAIPWIVVIVIGFYAYKWILG